MLRIKTIDIEIIRYIIFFCVWVGNSPSAPLSGPTFKVQWFGKYWGFPKKGSLRGRGGGRRGKTQLRKKHTIFLWFIRRPISSDVLNTIGGNILLNTICKQYCVITLFIHLHMIFILNFRPNFT